MMLALQIIIGLVLLLALAGLVIRVSHPLPPLEPRPHSRHFTDTVDTPLGQSVTRARQGQPDHCSGVHLLENGRDAFAARILLARAAVRSLDVQYYIWHNDLCGTLMLEAMRQAADRGVRVRLLLDDNGIAGLDTLLAALDHHPEIEIRLFNPFVLRRPKMLGYLADFFRLNRRMHNKCFIADGQAAIVGGRNIGDEYYDARDDGQFSDLDVLAIGPVVEDTARDFDRYWDSESAYPSDRILPPVPAEDLPALMDHARQLEQTPAAKRYIQAIADEPFIAQMLGGQLQFDWAAVRLISDNPAKGVGKAGRDGMLTTALLAAIGEPRRVLRLVSGYFVPTADGARSFAEQAASGVDVAIFTNAFEATDVWVVHAGYAERRKAMLRAGIRLFEMRGPDQDLAPNEHAEAEAGTVPPEETAISGFREKWRRRRFRHRHRRHHPRRRLIGTGPGGGGLRRRGIIGSGGIGGSGGPNPRGQVLRSSATTLHAKVFIVDEERLFIGSFNFDPRSMHLNTELGFLIESPALARKAAHSFETETPQRAYEVVLADDGRLNWIERCPDGRQVVHTTEPGMSLFQRSGIRLLSHMPIEWLL
ncbi:phospholipase D family protein [Croceibacterium xixiisoli]|uniref:phospholipase D family protein n=1 Tax=Croceibacterium xixiisoli TaxID=1476466 RepID=UPI001F1A29EC|nr:phospholipase D family protein [Croceibacterium xixiisoli]